MKALPSLHTVSGTQLSQFLTPGLTVSCTSNQRPRVNASWAFRLIAFSSIRRGVDIINHYRVTMPAPPDQISSVPARDTDADGLGQRDVGLRLRN